MSICSFLRDNSSQSSFKEPSLSCFFFFFYTDPNFSWVTPKVSDAGNERGVVGHRCVRVCVKRVCECSDEWVFSALRGKINCFQWTHGKCVHVCVSHEVYSLDLSLNLSMETLNSNDIPMDFCSTQVFNSLLLLLLFMKFTSVCIFLFFCDLV